LTVKLKDKDKPYKVGSLLPFVNAETSNVTGALCGVWCVVCGVWCVVCDVISRYTNQ